MSTQARNVLDSPVRSFPRNPRDLLRRMGARTLWRTQALPAPWMAGAQLPQAKAAASRRTPRSRLWAPDDGEGEKTTPAARKKRSLSDRPKKRHSGTALAGGEDLHRVEDLRQSGTLGTKLNGERELVVTRNGRPCAILVGADADEVEDSSAAIRRVLFSTAAMRARRRAEGNPPAA